jgi:HEAT repeat protein
LLFDSEAGRLSALWKELASNEVPKTPERGSNSYRAMSSFVNEGNKTVAFLKDKLVAVKPKDLSQLQAWIANLDSKDFRTRTQATQELRNIGEFSEQALIRALASSPPIETKRRIEELLDEIRKPVSSSEKLQTLRAIEVLEHIGTPEARDLLANLAKGALEARVTREAKASLDRLRQRAEIGR